MSSFALLGGSGFEVCGFWLHWEVFSRNKSIQGSLMVWEGSSSLEFSELLPALAAVWPPSFKTVWLEPQACDGGIVCKSRGMLGVHCQASFAFSRAVGSTFRVDILVISLESRNLSVRWTGLSVQAITRRISRLLAAGFQGIDRLSLLCHVGVRVCS